MSDESAFLLSHDAHDPAALIARWRVVAERCGLSVSAFAEVGDHELLVLRTESPTEGAPQVYLSTGVHGDEPGAALGLLHWAEANTETLRELDALVFPLMNPWGLENNIRLDVDGRDLNRLFHSDEEPFPAWRRELGEVSFDLAICLHEDYDARGNYIYELGLGGLAEGLLVAGTEFIPPESRTEIDVSEAVGGVVRHGDIKPEDFPLEGLPEAVWLFFNGCPVSLTLETPSEFSLWARVHAHSAMVGTAISTLRSGG